MRDIYAHKETPSEAKMMERIKQTTKAQIDIRFRNCTHNRTYKFPERFGSNGADHQNEDSETHTTVYDLYSQRELTKRTASTKTLLLEPNRRVKSLEKEYEGPTVGTHRPLP
jgi:chromatin remodeling complex protein RSC6